MFIRGQFDMQFTAKWIDDKMTTLATCLCELKYKCSSVSSLIIALIKSKNMKLLVTAQKTIHKQNDECPLPTSTLVARCMNKVRTL